MRRVEHSLKNLLFGGISQAVSSLLSFAARYALIHILGLEAVSLNGLFTEVLAMLSMAELGVGTAIVYNLYKPLRERDEVKLAQLMNLFRTAYRLIALSIFCIGLLLLPFVHRIVTRMEIDLWYLRLVYLLFLVQTASSYLFIYKSALIGADQKGYIVSQCTMAVKTVSVAVSIVFLMLTRNYIVYLLLQIAAALANNIVISIRADRRYPLLKRKDRLPAGERKQILSNVRHLFISVLSGKIINSTDNILISTLVGTLSIGAYGCYTTILNAVKSLLLQLNSATSGSIGNLVAEGDHARTELVIRRLTFITFCPAVFAAVEIYTVSTPFIRLVYGEEYLLPRGVVFLCVVNFFIYLVKNPLWSVMGASGLFAQDKNISLAGDGVNLLVSIVLGRRLGIAGILLGTSCALLLEHALKVRLLFGRFLRAPVRPYAALLAKEAAVLLLCMQGAQAVCGRLPATGLWLQMLSCGLCSAAVVAVIALPVFYGTPEFRYLTQTVSGIWKRADSRGKKQT